jgi:hypothetical protein
VVDHGCLAHWEARAFPPLLEGSHANNLALKLKTFANLDDDDDDDDDGESDDDDGECMTSVSA